jgi:HEPN domain-containing protein
VSIWKTFALDAQQAAEKSIKAVFISRDVDFPYVHDLASLLTLFEQAGEEIPSTIWDAVELTRFAIVTRYPGLAPPVTAEEHAEAVRLAEAVLAWAEQQIRQA